MRGEQHVLEVAALWTPGTEHDDDRGQSRLAARPHATREEMRRIGGRPGAPVIENSDENVWVIARRFSMSN